MSPPVLSVVIPTRDRLERLRQTLEALAEQEAGGAVEAVVVDDGSSDGTAAFLAAPPALGLALRCLRQEPRGPAAARNRGIAAATAARVLLLGDDTRPAPGTLAQHLRAAAGREVGVQGLVDWDPEEEVTPVMRFLAPAGPQFYFKGLTAGAVVPYTAVLGSNLAAPRHWFLDQPFDEAFRDAACEDTELAWRWRRRRRRVIYHPAAVCWHHHRYASLEPFLARQEGAGRAARRAVGLHPGMLPAVVVQPLLYGLLVALRHRFGRRPHHHDTWDLACRRAFWRGFVRRTRAR